MFDTENEMVELEVHNHKCSSMRQPIRINVCLLNIPVAEFHFQPTGSEY